MAQSKIAELINTLNKSQLKRLNEFVYSPYYNTDEMVMKLFVHYEKHHGNTNADDKARKIITDANKLAKTQNKLLRLAEHFIALELNEDEWALPLTVIDSYKKLKLNKHYQYTLEKTQARLQQILFKEIEHYWYLHKLIETDINRFESRNHRKAENSIMPVIESLDIFYLSKKLRYLCEAANRSDVFNIIYNNQQHELLLQLTEQYNNERHPYIYIFYRIYLALTTADIEQASTYYYELKKFLPSTTVHIHPIDLKEIYSYLINMVMKWGNVGRHEFLKEQFYLHNEKIKHNLIVEDGQISPHVFRNIFMCAVKAEENHWARKFIETYAEKLPKKNYDDAVNFAWGYYYYHTKRYGQALDYLNKTDNIEDVISNILARKLYLKCKYETDTTATTHLMSRQEAFDKYLLRHKKEIGTRMNLLKPFVKYFGKLIASNKADAKEVLQLLQTENYFPDKEWLEEMLKRIK